jgi:predicted nucleotidyltransferase
MRRVSPAARQIVSNMTDVLVHAAYPKRIILFGSQARGEAASHSDFDIMVVEDKPVNRFGEIVRLNRLLRSFDMAIDLLVVSDEKFQYWRDTPGNVYYEAATEGLVLYEAA